MLQNTKFLHEIYLFSQLNLDLIKFCTIPNFSCQRIIRKKLDKAGFDLPSELLDCTTTNYLMNRMLADANLKTQRSGKGLGLGPGTGTGTGTVTGTTPSLISLQFLFHYFFLIDES